MDKGNLKRKDLSLGETFGLKGKGVGRCATPPPFRQPFPQGFGPAEDTCLPAEDATGRVLGNCQR
jgi:hypothetical protein